MKVLYLHQHFVTPRGAGGTRSYEMAQRLIERGHSVTMVCGSINGGHGAVTGLSGAFTRGVRKGLVDGIWVIELELPYSNADSFARRSFTFLKFSIRSMLLVFSERYDLLFATSTPLTVAIPALAGKWIRRRPMVFEVRDLWPELPRAMGVISNPIVLRSLELLEKAAYRSASSIIALSPGMAHGIGRVVGTEKNVQIVSNGCDNSFFSADDSQAVRPANIDPSALLAVYTGTHGRANGIDAVINAAAELKRRGRNDIVLLLVGAGATKESLEKRVVAENLSNVRFLSPMPKRELAELLSVADLGLQILQNVEAFYDGTSPNKFFDYLSASLPILINYPGWLAKQVTEEGCGIVVVPDSPTDFADGLEWAATHRNELRSMGAQSRHLAESRFDRDQLGALFVDTLENALEKSRTK